MLKKKVICFLLKNIYVKFTESLAIVAVVAFKQLPKNIRKQKSKERNTKIILVNLGCFLGHGSKKSI